MQDNHQPRQSFLRRITIRNQYNLSVLSATARTRTNTRAQPSTRVRANVRHIEATPSLPPTEQQQQHNSEVVDDGDASIVPSGSPYTSAAPGRTQRMIGFDRQMVSPSVNGLHDGQFGGLASNSRLLQLPRAIRERIWRYAVVKDRMVTVCGCRACAIVHGPFAALTKVCQDLRAETIDMFYRDNRFMMPIGHDTRATPSAWLTALTPAIRALLRHFEVPSFDIATTAMIMYENEMELATNIAIPEIIMWYRQQVKIYWPIFRAFMPTIDRRSSIADSISSSILDLYNDEEATIETPQHMTLQRPPLVRLTLADGQEMEPPGWASPHREQVPPLRSRVARRQQQEELEQQSGNAAVEIITDRLHASWPHPPRRIHRY